MSTVNAVVYETYYLGMRTMRRFLRVPSNWIGIIFFPLIQLLIFSQLFQDIVRLPEFEGDVSYLAYLAPGQVTFTAFLATAWSGYGMIMEFRSGYLEKLRSTPIRRWSILAAEMVPLFFQASVMAGILLLVSVILGARIATGVVGFVLILGLTGLFALALAGSSFVPALLTKSEQATGAFSMMLFPVMFISTAFVPASLMPVWMQHLNDWNPITYVIEAMRSLMITGYDWTAIGEALVALAVTGLVLQTATIWAFHRLSK